MNISCLKKTNILIGFEVDIGEPVPEVIKMRGISAVHITRFKDINDIVMIKTGKRNHRFNKDGMGLATVIAYDSSYFDSAFNSKEINISHISTIKRP